MNNERMPINIYKLDDGYNDKGMNSKELIKDYKQNIQKWCFIAVADIEELKSVQVMGKAELIEPFSDKYNEHAEIKKIPIEALKKLESPMNLICVTPVKMDVLFSDFKKDGYSSRQILK